MYSGSMAAALSADPALLGASTSATVTSQTTIILATCLSAVGTLMVVLIIALGVRRFRKAKPVSANKNGHIQKGVFTGASLPYGFNSVGSKFGQAADEDVLSNVSTSTFDTVS